MLTNDVDRDVVRKYCYDAKYNGKTQIEPFVIPGIFYVNYKISQMNHIQNAYFNK